MKIDPAEIAEVLKPPPVQVLTPQSLGGLEVSTVKDTATKVNMIIFGDSGVGKTRLAGTASLVPEMSPVLFLDIEGGVTSLRHLYPDIHVIRVTTFDQIQKAYNTLFEGKSPYKTVIIDSLTEAQKYSMYGVMKAAKLKDEERDPDLPGIGEWGKNTEQIRRLVRAYRDLPNINTIFTCTRTDDRDPRTGVTTILPNLSNKLAKEVAALVDEVLYYYVKAVGDEYKRLLLTTKTEKVVAKDRSDNLPPLMEDPTMQQIYNYMTHRISRDNKPVTPTETSENVPSN